MTRELIPSASFRDGEVLQAPSGRLCVVRRTCTNGEIETRLLPGDEPASFQRVHLRRPHPGQPCALVFLNLDERDEAHEPEAEAPATAPEGER